MKEQEKRTIKKLEEDFYINVLQDLYMQELRRNEAIHSQSSRLAVFQTLFHTAIYTILPTMINEFVYDLDLIWTYIALISILGIFSIMCTVFSQWAIKNKKIITISNINSFLSEHNNISIYEVEKMINSYKKQALETQLMELERMNHIRKKWLQLAMELFVINIFITLIFILMLVE